MAEAMDDGGPAFPTGEDFDPQACVDGGQIMQYKVSGMSLRDYFAAKALQAWLPAFLDSPVWLAKNPGSPITAGFTAGCYAMADAMLTARNTK